jgi:hypothetical protein
MMEFFEKALEFTLPAAAMVAAALLLLAFLYRYFSPFWVKGAAFEASPVRRRSGRRDNLRRLAWIAAWLIGTRLFLYLIALVGCAATGQLENYLTNPGAFWVQWDANHYLGLANNWYVNEGDPRFHIVFYPLYPLAVRVFQPIFLGNTALAATVLSNLFLLTACWALYELARPRFHERGAKNAVRFLLLFPTSLYLSVPYSESNFLMLTLLSVLAARRDRIWLAVLFGALASASRIQGLLCAIPVFYEALRLEASDGRPKAGRVALRALQVSLIALGFGAYLLLNWQVTGNPFQFLIYQREHWSQTMGSIGGTLRYTIENAFHYDSASARQGIWIPQLVAIVSAFVLMGVSWRRVHPADGAYALLYAWVSFSPTWLLSGPRYLMAMYALYPIIVILSKGRWRAAAATALMALGTVYCALSYAVFGSLL